MPLSLHGLGVAKGCAIGKAFIFRHDWPDVVEYPMPAALLDSEAERCIHALAVAKQQLVAIRQRLSVLAPAELTAFVDTHLLILDDASLLQGALEILRQRGCNAEWAFKLQHDRIVSAFEAMDDPYLRARQDDIGQVVRRIQRVLLSADSDDVGISRLEGRIVIADDLAPADVILLHHQGVLALVTEYGGPLSHTAILARSLRIPTVVGARQARRYIGDAETIVVDGREGVVIAALDECILQHYRHKQQAEARQQQALGRLKAAPALTRDAALIALHANIDLPEDIQAVQQVAAAGVGLYRTEFLYLNRTDRPDEEEHLAAYLHVINALDGAPITIRSMDLGADKPLTKDTKPGATNPALGLRGIRLCLRHVELFLPQLRAVLRAAASGQVRLLLPMLTTLQEVRQTRQLLTAAKRELQAQGLPFDDKLAVGGMIETPAAAVCAAHFARQLDFLSIGTNDLIQYTLAMDRNDDTVSYLYDPLHPAVLQLIDLTLRAGRAAGIPVSMCGEMAGDPRYTALLLSLGLTEFSMHPANLLEVKQAVADCDRQELLAIGQNLLQGTDFDRLQQLLRRLQGL